MNPLVKIRRRDWLAILPFGLASARSAEDQWGGWAAHALRSTNRFRVQPWKGASWLVTPAGHPLLVVGLCHAQWPPPDLRVPGDATAQRFGRDEAAYAADVVRWMRRTGFNTFSYGVPKPAAEMNRLGELNLIPGFIQKPLFPDLYDPQWRAQAASRIGQLVPVLARDPRIIAYVLSNPVLFSPVMERPGIWREGIARCNWMMAVMSLPGTAAGKHKYVGYLRRTYGDFAAYRSRRGFSGPAAGFDGLLNVDLAAADEYGTLHPDDAGFYTELWSDLTQFFVQEIRKYDLPGLIFSYRFIRIMRWPDPWVEAMLRGVGPHVDAFVPELYADNPCREIVDAIGRITGKPSLLGDGMRMKEFLYRDEADDEKEAFSYASLYRSLLGSPWYLGSCICQYQDRLPEFPWYSPRPQEGRTGVRNADYSDRRPLAERFRLLHTHKYQLRLRLLPSG